MKNFHLIDNLIVSSPGIGGLSYLEGLTHTILSRKSSTGIYLGAEGFFCGIQQDGGNHLLVARDGHSKIAELSSFSLDIHDVLIHKDLIYFVATQKNEVFCMDINFNYINSWKLPGEDDSWHINSIAIYKERLIASAFGSFKIHREYKNGTLELGKVFDVQTREVLINGLSQPHSLTVENNYLYICNSEKKEFHIYDDFTLVKRITVPGYARGLALGKNHIYVGVSLSRNVSFEESENDSGSIAVFDKSSMQLLGLNKLSFAEIYDVRIVNHCAHISLLQTRRLIEIGSEVTSLNHEVTSLNHEVASLNHEVTSLNHEVTSLNHEVTSLNHEVTSLGRSLEELYASTSWKITAPIRIIKRYLSCEKQSKVSSKPLKLIWNDDFNLTVNELTFRLSFDTAELQTGHSSDNIFLLGKPRSMVEKLSFIGQQNDIHKIFEMGILHGGSVVLNDQLFSLKKLVAIDFNTQSVESLSRYIDENKRLDFIKPYYGVNQADRLKVNEILTLHFPNKDIDLIIDDASHLYNETREAFNITFPYLRKGGLYIIEDWAWAHWSGDYWQKGGNDFLNGKTALSNLLIELFMLSASRPDLIKSINIQHDQVVVIKGEGATPEGKFNISDHYLLRGKRFDPFL